MVTSSDVGLRGDSLEYVLFVIRDLLSKDFLDVKDKIDFPADHTSMVRAEEKGKEDREGLFSSAMTALKDSFSVTGFEWKVRFLDLVLDRTSNTVSFAFKYNGEEDCVGIALVRKEGLDSKGEILRTVQLAPTKRQGIILRAQSILMAGYLNSTGEKFSGDNHKDFETISGCTPKCVVRTRLSHTEKYQPA